MSEMDHITGRQIAAGRVLAGIGQDELAQRANISVPTLRRMEASDGPATGLPNNVLAVRRALEDVGVVFLETGSLIEGGQGVRLHVTANTPEALTSKIKTLQRQLAEPEPDLSPSPEAGMHRLERARKKHVLTTLKNRRTKLTKDK
jgi:transcriptional regulator with XRE-family HTH domain